MNNLLRLSLVTLVAWTAPIPLLAADVPTRILMLGDSLTAQTESRLPLYKKLTSEGFLFEFVGSQDTKPLLHEGHSGFTIGPDASKPGNIADNIELWIQAAKPDVIFLLIGNNDYNYKPGTDLPGAPNRLAALLDKITTLAPDAEVLVGSVLSIAPEKDYAGALNRKMPAIVDELKSRGRRIRFVDLNKEVDLVKGAPPFSGSDSDYIDGVHLNSRGGEKLAAAWFAHLTPLLKRSSP